MVVVVVAVEVDVMVVVEVDVMVVVEVVVVGAAVDRGRVGSGGEVGLGAPLDPAVVPVIPGLLLVATSAWLPLAVA